MPTLKIYSPSRTEVPKKSRRRVWTSPAVTSHAVAILTPARLYLAPGSGPVKPDTVKALENGADVEQMFGSLTIVVNLPTVVRAVLDLPANTVHVEFAGGPGRPGTSRVSVSFAEAETADAMFTKLWRRLGEGWKIRPIRPAQWDRLKVPGATLGGILLATTVVGVLAAVAQDSAPGSGDVFRLLDWRIVCGLGGVLAAAAQVWLYRRTTQPAAKLELVRGQEARMRREDVQDILTRIPEVDLSKTQVLLRNGYVLSVDIVLRFEQFYCVIRGREGGTTDEGRGFFIPYEEVVAFKLERPMKLSEMNRMYGVDSGVDSEDKLAIGAERKDEAGSTTAVTPGPGTPPPTVIDPAQIAKNNLLARIRAARTAAGVVR